MFKYLICISMISMGLFAQRGKPYGFSIGPGVIGKTSIRFDNRFDGADKPTNFRMIPFARAKLGPFELSGGGLKYNPRLKLPLSPFLTLSRMGEKYYGPDMDTRKDSWALGLGLKFREFQLKYDRDVQSRSNGAQLSFGYHKMYRYFDRLTFIPGLEITYSDDHFSDYYYGVKANEETVRRSVYTPGASFAYSVSSMTSLKIMDGLSTTLILRFTQYDSNVNKSPTTKKDYDGSFVFGFSYDVI